MAKSINKKRKSEEDSYKKLELLIGVDRIIEIKREKIDEYTIHGFVVGISDTLLLLHSLDDHTMQLNGYCAIRLQDISEWRIVKGFFTSALRLLCRTPEVPQNISLQNWQEFIPTALRHYAVITIEAEKRYPGCLFIGIVVSHTDRSFMFKEINPDAIWRKKPRRYDYADITTIALSGGYSNALIAVMKNERPEEVSW